MDKPSTITVAGIGVGEGNSRFFPLVETEVFPHRLALITVSGDLCASAVDDALKSDRLLAIFPEVPPRSQFEALPNVFELKVFEFNKKTYSANGILVRIVKNLNYPDGSQRITVRGLNRIAFINMFRDGDGVLKVHYSNTPDRLDTSESEARAKFKGISMAFQEYAAIAGGIPEDELLSVLNAEDVGQGCDIIADDMNFREVEKFLLLSMSSVNQRLDFLATLLNREVETTRLGIKIQKEVHNAMTESQREYYLREQLRTIQNELGEDTRNPDIVELEGRLANTKLPEDAEKVVK